MNQMNQKMKGKALVIGVCQASWHIQYAPVGNCTCSASGLSKDEALAEADKDTLVYDASGLSGDDAIDFAMGQPLFGPATPPTTYVARMVEFLAAWPEVKILRV